MKNIFVLLSVVLFSACGNEPVPVESKVVPVKKDSVMPSPYKDAVIEVVTFDNSKTGNKGFGYDIKIDGKMNIHQPNIPGLPGNDGFTTEDKAKKTGEFVAYKIRNNIMPPSVSEKELDSLGVLK